MAYKYKNVSGMDQDVVGVGLVKADETVDVQQPIYNSNFELVNGDAGHVPVERPAEDPILSTASQQTEPTIAELEQKTNNSVEGIQ